MDMSVFADRGPSLRDESGGLVFVGAVTDITERRRTEDAVLASEQNLRQIVDSIPGLVVLLTWEGEVELVNRQA